MSHQNNHNYRLHDPRLNSVVVVKALRPFEIELLRIKLLAAVRKQHGSFLDLNYKETIVKELIVKGEDLIYGINNFDFPSGVIPLDRAEVIACLYEVATSINLYAALKLESMCGKLNVEEYTKAIKKEDPNNLLGKVSATIKGFNDKLALEELESYLKHYVIGQDEAIASLLEAASLMAVGFEDWTTLFFRGPTGCGKTEMALRLAEKYSGKFLKIDCGQFSEGHEKNTILGSPPGYVGSGESSLLAEKAKEGNNWVILFDEIEKSSMKFRDVLLGLLDTGIITDNQGKLLDFSKSIFIFTSNVGVQEARLGRKVGFSDEEISYEDSHDSIEESFKKEFKPEFINRMDEVITFNQLTQVDIEKIAKLMLSYLPISQSKPLIRYVAENGFSKEYGARFLRRYIRKHVAVPLAKVKLSGGVPTGRLYKCKVNKSSIEIIGYETPELKEKEITDG